MATYEDLLSVMNNPGTNPLGLPADQALATTNNQPVSKLEQKQQSITNRLAEKQQSLVPQVNHFDPVDSGSVLSLANASLHRAGGNLADAGKGVSNYLFGTDFDDSEESGWSNQANADQAAGVSQAYRNEYNNDLMQVLQDVKNDDYLGALGSSAKVAFRAAADSAATLPELALGTAMAGVGGGAIAARRLQKMSKTADNIIDAYKKLPEPTMLGKVAKESTKASIMTADIVQQQRNEYKAENNGEEPSAARLAGMTALTLATTAWTPQIIEKLYIPKLGRKKEDVNLRTQYMEEIKSYMEKAEKGVMYQMASRIAEGIPKVALAGGAEAVQEYGQFWAETIGTQLKPEEMGGYFEGIISLANDQGLQDEALQSAFVGGAAGAATRIGLADAPSLAIGTAFDTTYKVGNSIRKRISDSIDSQLSNSDLFAKSAEAEARKKAANETEERNKAYVDVLNDATTVDDIQDETLKERVVRQAKDRDLSDSEVFNTVINETTRSLARETVAAKASVIGKQAKDVSEKVKNRAVEETKKVLEAVGITPETIEKAVADTKEFAEETGKKLKEEYENFPQSTTLALIEGVTQYSGELTKDGAKQLEKLSRIAGQEATKAVARSIEKDNPKTAAKLRDFAAKQIRAQRSANQKSDRLTRSDNLPKTVVMASATQSVPDKAVNTSVADILDVGKTEFADTTTVRTVRQSIAAVKKSKEFSNLSGETQKAVLDLDTKLTQTEKDLTKLPEKVANLSTKVKNRVVPAIVSAGESAYNLMNKGLEKASTSVDKVVEEIDNMVAEQPADNTMSFEQAEKIANAIDVSNAPEVAIQQYQQIMANVEGVLTSAAKESPERLEEVFNDYLPMLANSEVTEIVKTIVGDDPKAIQSLYVLGSTQLSSPEFSKRLGDALTGTKTADEKVTKTDTKPKQNKSTEKSSKREEAVRKEFDSLTPEQKGKLKVKTVEVDEDTRAEGYDNSIILTKDDNGNTEAAYNTPVTDEEVDSFIEENIDKSVICDGKD